MRALSQKQIDIPQTEAEDLVSKTARRMVPARNR